MASRAHRSTAGSSGPCQRAAVAAGTGAALGRARARPDPRARRADADAEDPAERARRALSRPPRPPLSMTMPLTMHEGRSSRTKRAALAAIVLSTVAIGVAYASAY